MNRKELKDLIKKGESRKVEFKESLSLKDEIGENVSAFSNTNKGIILVGISDTGKIKGVQVGKKTLEELANYIKQHTDNPIYPKIDIETIDSKKIITIEIDEHNEKPVFYKGKAYKRVGKSIHKLSASEVRKLAKESGKKAYWDEQICEDASLKDIDGKAVDKYKELYEEINKTAIKSSNKELLKSLKCVKEADNKIKITNAGILLFGKKPENFFPMNYVTIARYPGKEKAQTYSDIKDFSGNLFDVLDNTNEYIKEHVQEISKVIEGKLAREVIPQYPYFAIRELITNAIVHRKYSIRGSRIIIRMFKDRIEFNSPGGLPLNITPKNILDEQYSRNPIISDVFSKVRYIEKLGEGWDKIISAVKEHPLKPKLPKIRDTGNTVIVVLFSPNEFVDKAVVPKSVPKSVPKNLSDNQKKIIEKIANGIKISKRGLADEFNVDYRQVQRDLDKLKKMGLISFIGPKKGGHWKIK